uniref:Uncharacterized protein n=1 Tax=Octopus bimaculoides TaxID=37653 RepID=A0A0L8IA25_OCTBM
MIDAGGDHGSWWGEGDVTSDIIHPYYSLVQSVVTTPPGCHLISTQAKSNRYGLCDGKFLKM